MREKGFRIITNTTLIPHTHTIEIDEKYLQTCKERVHLIKQKQVCMKKEMCLGEKISQVQGSYCFQRTTPESIKYRICLVYLMNMMNPQ